MNRVISFVSAIAHPRTSAKAVGVILAVIAHALATPALLAQQEGVIAGVVTGANTQPLAGAQVRVEGSTLGAMTDASGRFRISGLAEDQATIEVRRLGYRVYRRVVRVGETNLRIEIGEQSVALDAIVVTGTAGGQSKRELGNAVTTINASEAKEIAPINSVQNLLNGRAPGVFVNSATGNVGAGARIRIRGASSIALLNEPLIYVDGVRVNNNPASGPANQAFGSSSISRINDINPDEIESVEVIRGPAAATLYGTEASNGVIQIITKKGTTGAPRWSLAVRQGTNYLRDPKGRWPVNWQTVPRLGGPAGARDTVSIDIIELEEARGTPVFTSGHLQEYDLSASGGSGLFRYFASLGMEDSDGIEPVSNVKRYSGRANLSIVPNSKFDLGFNLGYLNGTTFLPPEAGFGGRTWTTISANPANFVFADGRPGNPRRGFHSGLPEQYDALNRIWQDVNRFTGGIQINHRPTSWFRHRLNAGTDQTREDDNFLFPRTEDSLSRVIFGGNGGRSITTQQVNYYTLDYSASGIFDATRELHSTTSFGAQYYRNTNVFQSASGDVFPTVGLTALSATTQNRTSSGDVLQDATLGFFLQEQLGWRDRLFLTAAIRADDNSAFGENFDRVYYPKYSASWVVNEEPFWRWPVVDALKLRAAYGEAGKQPVTFSALQVYTTATGPSDVATVTPLFIGNPDLGPERSKEVEMGFDLGAFRDRAGIEFTWYRKKTLDAILDRQIAPSLGLPNTQPFNAGSIRNSGIEMLLRATPVMRDAVQWDVSFNWATNTSKIESLGTSPALLELRRQSTCPGYAPGTSDPASCPVADFVVGGSFLRHQVGRPIGSYFEQRVVSAELLPTGAANVSRVMCDDGRGGTMVCAGADLTYNTPDDAPEVFIGPSLPRAEGALSSTVSLWKRFRVYAMLDFKRDYYKVDGNTRVRCQIFIRCRENFFPLEFDPKRIAAIQSNGQLVDYYINNAGYTKLREVSLSYTLPAINTRWVTFSRAVVTLAGRNLYTWTDYPGLEPEAFFLGGSRGGNFGQFEQTTNPQLSQWVLGLNVDW